MSKRRKSNGSPCIFPLCTGVAYKPSNEDGEVRGLCVVHERRMRVLGVNVDVLQQLYEDAEQDTAKSRAPLHQQASEAVRRFALRALSVGATDV